MRDGSMREGEQSDGPMRDGPMRNGPLEPGRLREGPPDDSMQSHGSGALTMFLRDRIREHDRSVIPPGNRDVDRNDSDEEVLPLVYDEMRRLAQVLLRGEQHETLQATALVHEAWLRMIDPAQFDGEDIEVVRRHFLALAARAMRWIFVDRARERQAKKRGGAWKRITLYDAPAGSSFDPSGVLDIDAALEKLDAFRPRLARVAELRLFAGLSAGDVAATLGISVSLANDEWALARSLMSQSLAAR